MWKLQGQESWHKTPSVAPSSGTEATVPKSLPGDREERCPRERQGLGGGQPGLLAGGGGPAALVKGLPGGVGNKPTLQRRGQALPPCARVLPADRQTWAQTASLLTRRGLPFQLQANGLAFLHPGALSAKLLMPETSESFLMTFPPLHLTVNKSPSAITVYQSKYILHLFTFLYPSCLHLFPSSVLHYPHLKILLAVIGIVTNTLQSKLLNKYSWKKRSLKSPTGCFIFLSAPFDLQKRNF